MAGSWVGWQGRWWYRVGGTTASPTLLRAEDSPPVGAILAVKVKGVQHEGLWSGSDVIHSSARRGLVARESLDAFTGRDRMAFVVGQAPPESVSRAAAALGEKWTPLDNCQRFVVRVSGVRRRSADANKLVMVAGAVAYAVVQLASR